MAYFELFPVSLSCVLLDCPSFWGPAGVPVSIYSNGRSEQEHRWWLILLPCSFYTSHISLQYSDTRISVLSDRQIRRKITETCLSHQYSLTRSLFSVAAEPLVWLLCSVADVAVQLDKHKYNGVICETINYNSEVKYNFVQMTFTTLPKEVTGPKRETGCVYHFKPLGHPFLESIFATCSQIGDKTEWETSYSYFSCCLEL